MRVVLVISIVLATLGSGPASATSPERHSLSYDESFETADIYGFPIMFEWIGTGYGRSHDPPNVPQNDPRTGGSKMEP
jgi:hypothetical protein